MNNKEFFELLNDNLENKIEDNDDNLCLISGDMLNETKIELTCGHKYNYIPLYNEIRNQKWIYSCKFKRKIKRKIYKISNHQRWCEPTPNNVLSIGVW